MDLAFANALQEITLVLFTTLAPASTVACMFVAYALVREEHPYEVRYSIAKSLVIPLCAATAGLVFSATHLGNPSNALYVLLGVGRSPLSNEVAAAALFLMCVGMFWVFSFSRTWRMSAMRIGFAVMVCFGVLFLVAIAFAYSVDTIFTWVNPANPVTSILCALWLGPRFSEVCLAASQCPRDGYRFVARMRPFSFACLGAACVAYAILGALVLGQGNSFFMVSELVPFYWLAYALFVALGIVSSVGLSRSLDAPERDSRALHATVINFSWIAVGFAAIFLMRFLFYQMHLTVGMGM